MTALHTGLGARLGPLVAATALVDGTAAGQRLFTRPLRGKIRQGLGDSKRLVKSPMGRISRYPGADELEVSGYHEPRTCGWSEATRAPRRSLKIVDECFERARDTAS